MQAFSGYKDFVSSFENTTDQTVAAEYYFYNCTTK